MHPAMRLAQVFRSLLPMGETQPELQVLDFSPTLSTAGISGGFSIFCNSVFKQKKINIFFFLNMKVRI